MSIVRSTFYLDWLLRDEKTAFIDSDKMCIGTHRIDSVHS